MRVIDVPRAIAAVLCVILLDGAVYAQHVLTHKVLILWRLSVHHADTGSDVSTALRFHPLEVLLDGDQDGRRGRARRARAWRRF